MPNNVLDRRVQKTRKLLQEALIALASEKDFDTIKIQDILDKANVGRSTFYAHFEDKHELLYSCFDEVHKLLEQHASMLTVGARNSGDFDLKFNFSLRIFQFVERNKMLFKALLGKQGIPAFVEDFIFNYINEPLKIRLQRGRQRSIPPEIITYYFINAFIGIIRWWVNQDTPCTAEEIDKYFKQLAMPSIKDIFGN
jgi:AcrR family transcriptional regulator